MLIAPCGVRVVEHDVPLLSKGQLEIAIREPGASFETVLAADYCIDCDDLAAGGCRAVIPWEADRSRADYSGPFRIAEILARGEQQPDGSTHITSARLHATMDATEIEQIASQHPEGASLDDVEFMTYFKPAINGQRLAQLSMAVRFGPCVTFPRLTTIGALRERAIVDRTRTEFGKGLARAKDGARAKFGAAIAPQLDQFIAQMLEPVQQHIDLRCDDTQQERKRVMGLLSVERIVVDAIQKQLLPALDRELAKAKQEEARIAAIETQERLQRNPFYFP